MSTFFPGFPVDDFGPLFRLLDDYDVHRAQGGKVRKGQAIRAFQPKFDVKELKDAYELHGELPGIEQKDVYIEFTDPQTLVIKGRTEREYTSGTPPSGAIEGREQAKLTEGGEDSHKYHKATVEDENAGSSTNGTQQTTDVAKSDQDKPQYKYWVSERSVGEFYRTFSFPARVNQDAVKASLKNGILSILVPKASAPVSKKIAIE